MKPARHVITSAFAGVTMWVLARDILAASICFFCGILPDLDHILEFIIHNGLGQLSIAKVYEMFPSTTGNRPKLILEKLYLIFHCGELAIILWVLSIWTRDLYLTAATTGYTLHLITDHRGNNMPKAFYFLIWRMRKNFDTKTMFNLKNSNISNIN